MGDETRPEGYVECREKCGRWKHHSQAMCWGCWFAFRPNERQELAEKAKKHPDWSPTISPPAEPATWRGMRVGQVVGDRRVVAVDADSATTITRSGVRLQWSRKSPHDRVVVESWTLVSDPDRIQEPPPVPPRPAKAEPAKAVCRFDAIHSGAVLLRHWAKGKPAGIVCDGCMLNVDAKAAKKTPFTKSPPPKAPRYPADAGYPGELSWWDR